MVIVAVTGTPACGKTYYAQKLAHDLGFTYVDVKDIISTYHLDEVFDKERDCSVIDEEKLNVYLMQLKGNLIIDSHLSHHLPPSFVTLCVVVKCPLPLLKKRLEERGYAKSKIRENLDAEIFDVCLVEASEAGHEVFILYSDEDYPQLLLRLHSL